MLDLMLQAWLARFPGAYPIQFPPVPTIRRVVEEAFLRLVPRARDTEGVELEERSVPGKGRQISVRLYRPGTHGPHPVLVYFHGGGFVFGSLDMYDGLCAALAREAACLVCSVDYGLAPEHPFPEPVEDAYSAVGWIRNQASSLGADPDRIGVGGDSAGGNLAAVVSLIDRDRGQPPLNGQLLIYPVTDLTGQTCRSKREFSQLSFEKDRLTGFQQNHLYLRNGEDARHPWASPILAEDVSGLPPAMIITAEHDPLCDQGEAYGFRLRDAGVAVAVKRYSGMSHGFVYMQGILPEAEQALKEGAMWLKETLSA